MDASALLSPPWVYVVAGGIAAVLFIVITVTALKRRGRRLMDRHRMRVRNERRIADKEHLRCPQCAHVFAFELPVDAKDWKRNVRFTCPECGLQGVLPPASATPVRAVVPGGERETRRFRCGNCRREWSVGVIGHRLKHQPGFDACPSCGNATDVQAL